MNENMTDIEPGIDDGAVKVYQGDMTDDFPVLKAFQQYIDAEQAKSRKRMMLLCVFFSIILAVVTGVFVTLLLAFSSKNQNLNDRLVEYAMKRDCERTPVVVQPAPDDVALRALADKLDALQKSVDEDRTRAAEMAKKDERPTVEALEIERLKALLAVEKEKAAAEREKKRQAEIEEYRRKHYPELYDPKQTTPPSSSMSDSRRSARMTEEEEAADREIESIINDIKAVSYFDEEDCKNSSDSTSSTYSVTKENVAPVDEGRAETSRGVKDASGTVWSIPPEE